MVNALYGSIERGLTADVLATRALGGQAYTACTAHVVAGHGVVTDVLEVPTDSVHAQLEHVFDTVAPTGAKVGIVGHPATVETVFRGLDDSLEGPFLLDLTLSGPSGEDIIGTRGLAALRTHLGQPDLVTIRRVDAELVTGMEIPSLDDAQVAVQRLARAGARRVLLRLGALPTHFYDVESDVPEFATDLYYDGEDFALFEAPVMDRPDVHGASSALTLAILQDLVSARESPDGESAATAHDVAERMPSAIQVGKAYVTEALKHMERRENRSAPHYYWNSA